MNCAKVQTGEKYWVNYQKKKEKKVDVGSHLCSKQCYSNTRKPQYII